ncbi:MAG: HPr family phosphocarrier protein [Verrucomicrobia bacterium]|nr:HPr family phosphocarrier protein [Verrucomicrobiota bacterium]
MVELKAVVKNEAGIHCRPTAVITQAAAEVSSVITVLAPAGSAVLGSALELMMLGLEQGTLVTLQADGSDEEAAAMQFQKLFETNFDFPDAAKVG